MKAVGARVPRYDGLAHVTGRTQYVDDVRVHGTLWCKAVRSPHHSALITSIDTSRAEALPGVHAVVTSTDVPHNTYGHLEALGVPADEPLLAEGEVRWKGQVVAVIAAETEEIALAAVDAVQVVYEEREPVFDIRTASDPDAPTFHQWGATYPHFGPHNHRRVRKGDVDRAFADADVIAEGEVRWKGQVVAVIAAETEEIALAAVDAVQVVYEEREPVFDIRTASDPDAPTFHQWGATYPHFGPHNHRRVRKGDVDRAFADADVIVEGVYRPQAIEHVPLETQVALAVPEPSGKLTIYTCTQAMYFSMGVVAAHLEWPLNKLKLVGGTVGGGFGGKVDTATETLCALLAIKSRRPVKWRFTREEEFLVSSTRAPWHIELQDAVSKDGWILGRRTLTLHDSGAYARFSPYGVTKHAFHHTGAYTIPNVRFDGFVVFSNRVPTTAMRGFGVTSVSLATELHLNRVAEQVGMDPLELRLKNANRIGDTTGNRVVMHDPSTVTVTLAAADAVGYELGDAYREMTAERRTGELLPEHLVEQQAPEGDHAATYDPTLTNGGGH